MSAFLHLLLFNIKFLVSLPNFVEISVKTFIGSPSSSILISLFNHFDFLSISYQNGEKLCTLLFLGGGVGVLHKLEQYHLHSACLITVSFYYRLFWRRLDIFMILSPLICENGKPLYKPSLLPFNQVHKFYTHLLLDFTLRCNYFYSFGVCVW